ncbi:hypothetical protein [Hymenobacter arizonensis]|uniref:Uncharacterized protein n=1 Tax=Hymenobacter arizonensis TaxID=1227077 RepID=A0A1I5T8G1_HYMAR|nr:hypothetical protein [Hymenobacter arizonensis]SFP79332.1 hypothetical protein SAMN04515668_0363 [Hymenobacter arizonensis]
MKPDTTALLAAVEPIAAYVNRTPSPNKHADRCAALVDAVADYVEDVEQAEEARAAQPDWEALAYRMIQYVQPTPFTPLMQRNWAFLTGPCAEARAALPLAQRMALASITSHHLGRPAYL